MPQIRFASDEDALARTIVGEAGNEDDTGQVAVGSVALNRARNRNLTPAQVVLERNQFEPWGNPATAQRLLSLDTNSREYQRALANARRALAGEDPTGGASHFYSPTAQSALGRKPPSWDDGSGFDIGRHRFFRIEGQGGGSNDVQMAAAPMAAAGAEGQATGPWAKYASGASEVADTSSDIPEVTIDGGVKNVDGRAILVNPDGSEQDVGSWGDYWTGQRRGQADAEARVERQEDPEYQARYAESRSRAGNIPDWLLSLTGGATLGGSGLMDEILGGVDYVASGFDPTAGQAARDAVRDEQNEYANEKPLENLAFQVGGGFLTPGMGAAGNFITRGGQTTARLGQTGVATERAGRAAVVGAGYGAGSGFVNAEGNLIERAPGTAQGAIVGAGAGVIGQRATDRITGSLAARAAGEPARSAARRLSRRGVNLTPGQMASEIPILGPTIKYAEDIIGGFNPLMNGVRRRQNEDVVRAAGSEALAQVGQTLPRNARTGYQVSQNVMRVLGNEYDDVTAQITAQADQPLYDDLTDLIARAGQTLDDSRLSRLQRVLDQNIFSRFEPGGQLTGANFKRIETTLRQQSERANRPNSPLEDVDLSEFLDETREAVRNLIARQYPEQAERITNINRGYAIGKRVQRAVSGSPQMAREGTPLPGELTQTVQQMSSDGQISNQTGLLQGLASDARTVLPPGVADTGSGQRALLGSMGVLGTSGVAVVSPGLAAGIAAGAVIYSRPGIAALNALYRATDSRRAASVVRELERMAARNPALLPYYEAAAQHARALASPDTEAAPPARSATPAPIPVQ